MKFSLLRLLVFTAVIAVWAGLATAIFHSGFLDVVSGDDSVMKFVFSSLLVPLAYYLARCAIAFATEVTNEILDRF